MLHLWLSILHRHFRPLIAPPTFIFWNFSEIIHVYYRKVHIYVVRIFLSCFAQLSGFNVWEISLVPFQIPQKLFIEESMLLDDVIKFTCFVIKVYQLLSSIFCAHENNNLALIDAISFIKLHNINMFCWHKQRGYSHTSSILCFQLV